MEEEMKEKFGTLHYCTKNEEGEIKMTAELPETVVGMDILSDWIRILEAEYERLEDIVFPPDNPNSEEVKKFLGLRTSK
jgi:hypothetical protein